MSKYDLDIRLELMPNSFPASIDKQKRATVLVYVDWVETEFDAEAEWTQFIDNVRSKLPPRRIIELHSRICEQIIEEMGNDEMISFYTSADADESGHRPWSNCLRIPDQVRALTQDKDLSILVSLDSDIEGMPTRQALTRLREVVAAAEARYDEWAEVWLMIETILEREG
jgi:hypothetical protein